MPAFTFDGMSSSILAVQIPLLTDIVVVLGLSILVIMGFRKLGMPNILGFLITGVIAGPHGLSLVEASHEIDVLAEIGVILLLFVIGLEFSLSSLFAIKQAVLVGGGLQVVLTSAITCVIAMQFGFPLNEAVFLGFMFSLSSTAIVLKAIQEKRATHSPQGRLSLAVLIFQDVIVVLMMLLAPLLAGTSESPGQAILWMLLKSAGIIGFAIVGARTLVPWILYRVARTQSRELFILTIVVICFSVAWLTSLLGLSLSLGAFLAGLTISESEYSHQATGNILPFREIFTSIFFVSIGMLMDIDFVLNHIPVVLLLSLSIALFKGGIASFVGWILKYPPRTFLLVGLYLFQVGEFAFILAEVGVTNDLVSDSSYQYFLSASILTMAITPFTIEYGEKITATILKRRLPSRFFERIQMKNRHSVKHTAPEHKTDHIVIVGFGINGRNVAKAARYAELPYIILEMNPDTVKNEREKGEPIYYGDAADPTILHHADVEKARVVVVAISDPDATKKIIYSVRNQNQLVHLIVRTRFLSEMDENLAIGADEVIPEEFETSIEIFTRVMHKYLVPVSEINDFTSEIRNSNYAMLRKAADYDDKYGITNLALPNVEIVALRTEKAAKGIVNTPLKDTQIRETYDVNVVGRQRDGEYDFQLKRDSEFKVGDILYVVGPPEQIKRFHEAIKAD